MHIFKGASLPSAYFGNKIAGHNTVGGSEAARSVDAENSLEKCLEQKSGGPLLQGADGHIPHEGYRTGTGFRWAEEAFPLTIALQASSRLDLTTVMTWAEEWAIRSAYRVRFEAATEATESPQIVIRWREKTTLGRDYEVGHAERTVSQQGLIQHVEITLIESPRIDAALTPEEQQNRLKATVLHELGHALGLEHSTQHTDMMYHQGWQNTQLSTFDIQRLLTLYTPKTSSH